MAFDVVATPLSAPPSRFQKKGSHFHDWQQVRQRTFGIWLRMQPWPSPKAGCASVKRLKSPPRGAASKPSPIRFGYFLDREGRTGEPLAMASALHTLLMGVNGAGSG
jgi:hypothetical protein